MSDTIIKTSISYICIYDRIIRTKILYIIIKSNTVLLLPLMMMMMMMMMMMIIIIIIILTSRAQSVALRTWEQEVAGSIPGSANILSEDWW